MIVEALGLDINEVFSVHFKRPFASSTCPSGTHGTLNQVAALSFAVPYEG
jgi:hypothetical protein